MPVLCIRWTHNLGVREGVYMKRDLQEDFALPEQLHRTVHVQHSSEAKYATWSKYSFIWLHGDPASAMPKEMIKKSRIEGIEVCSASNLYPWLAVLLY